MMFDDVGPVCWKTGHMMDSGVVVMGDGDILYVKFDKRCGKEQSTCWGRFGEGEVFRCKFVSVVVELSIL